MIGSTVKIAPILKEQGDTVPAAGSTLAVMCGFERFTFHFFFSLAELTAAHFGGGGGLLRKKVSSEQQDEEEEKPKSRKELIEEMIAKSKQEKVSFQP